MSSSGKDKGRVQAAGTGASYQMAPQREGQLTADGDCGFFCLRPRCMQPLANRISYLLVYCSCGLVQGMWYTYFVSILTTVEKVFKFPSSVTGIILAGNDLAQIFFAVLISYYGGRGHRPRWVGAGMLLNALGCLLSALPQFVWGPDPDDVIVAMTGTSYNSSLSASRSADKLLCQLSTGDVAPPGGGGGADPCQETTDASLAPIVLLFVSQFVSGIGATAYYTLGLTYLDDSVDKKQSPIMFSISSGLRVMGPMMGFMLGSYSLSKFVIPSLQPAISQKDPRWIGAWWLGFFVLAGLLVVVSFLICLFPKRLNTIVVETERRISQDDILMDKMIGSMDEVNMATQPSDKLAGIKGLKDALSRLLRNALLMVLLINVVFAVTGFIGYFTFMPKYQMAAFKKSAAQASLFTGLSGVLVTLVGYLGSGVVIKLLQPRAVFVTAYSALVSGVQTVCMVALMAITCDEVPMHGSFDTHGQFLLTAECNIACGCNTDLLNPVCSQDGLASFFSPCFAGCQTTSKVNGSMVYGNCSCIEEVLGDTKTGGIMTHIAAATSGICELPCSSFVTYMIILSVMKFVGSTNRTGGILVFFRSVADEDKSLAIGLVTAFLSVFAFIPAPIIFGAVVDQTCLIWEQKPCGGRGNCLYYDTDKLRVHLHTAVIIPFAISFALDMVIVYLSRNLKLYGEDEKKSGKSAPGEGEKPGKLAPGDVDAAM